MPQTRLATLRYQALDRCFSDRTRYYFIEDLIKAVNQTLENNDQILKYLNLLKYGNKCKNLSKKCQKITKQNLLCKNIAQITAIFAMSFRTRIDIVVHIVLTLTPSIMKELKCPNCRKVFSVDEASYAEIVS